MLIRRISRGAIAGISVLLAFFFTLALGASLQKSPTYDETFQLLAGYSYLKWGDYRINPEHPPFAKLLAALPLLALKINNSFLTREQRDSVQESGVNGWRLANQWLFRATMPKNSCSTPNCRCWSRRDPGALSVLLDARVIRPKCSVCSTGTVSSRPEYPGPFADHSHRYTVRSGFFWRQSRSSGDS